MSDAILSPPAVAEPATRARGRGADFALRLRQNGGILGATALFLALYLFYHASHPRGFTSQVLIQNGTMPIPKWGQSTLTTQWGGKGAMRRTMRKLMILSFWD